MVELNPWAYTHVEPVGEVAILDMSSISFAKPASIVALCTKLEGLTATGASISVIAPASTDVANYLCRIRLPMSLDRMGVRHNFGSVTERNHSFAVVELATFTDADSVAALAESIHSFASVHSPDIAAALYEAVCEAGENVGFHSGAPHGYLMAQYFRNVGRFEFAIGDSGMGFYNSLRAVGAQSPQHSLELAATPGISSTGETTRGYGVASILSNVLTLGGSVSLATDDALQTFSASEATGKSARARAKICGSLLFGAIETSRRFRA